MKIKDFIAKIFNKKQNNQSTKALASIRNIVGIPKREEFLNDTRALQLIEQYKKEYSQTLKLNKTIVSTNLMPETLHNYKNIYLDLMVNVYTEGNSDISFEKINANSSEPLRIMIIKLKLDLYINEVRTMEKEAKLRIIALTEILDSIFFSKSKENAINNEIDNLSFAIATFKTQIIAMEKEKDNYLNDLRNLKLNEFKNAEEEQEIIKKYLDELIKIANLVLPEELKELKKLNLSPKLLIAKLEQLLEIYVYTHQDVLNELKEEIEQMTPFVLRTTLDNPQQIAKYLARIKDIEMLFKIFSKYGRNLVSKTDLENLYQVKFKLLTYNIFDKKFDILDDITFTELECYQDIIFKKIEQILKGNNRYVNDLASKSDLVTVINYIKDILKLDKNEFSMYEILKNRRTLSFLLAFDKYNGLEDFFKNEEALKIEYNDLNYYDNTIFKWQNKLPLDTIFRIMRSNIETEPNADKIKRSSLYYLHQIQKEFNPSENYMLPEGLDEMNIFTYGKNSKPSDLLCYIRSLAKGQKVKMPTSLRRFHGKLFENTKIEALELNEGLKEIDSYALVADYVSELTIPSTLYEDKTLFNDLPNTINKITINNYKNNPNLNNIIHHIATKFYFTVYIDETYFVPSLSNLTFLDEEGKVAFVLTKEDLMLNEINIPNIRTIEDAAPEIQKYIESLIREKEEQLIK